MDKLDRENPAAERFSAEVSLGRGSSVRTMKRFGKNASAVIGVSLLAIMTILAVAAPVVTDHSPREMNTSMIMRSPMREHPMGTDSYGRDVLSRVLYGTRTSIFVALSVGVLTLLGGVVLGAIAGFYARFDEPVMRAMDIVMSFPSILLALAIVAVLRPQLTNIVIALAVVYAARSTRVVRGVILSLKEKEFVEAARCTGATDWRILTRHLLPNCVAPVLIQQTYIIALAILAEAALNFLGVGVPPQVPTLGGIITDARDHLRYAPWLSLYPGIAISMLVLGFNLLGDGLRDVLDPRMRL